MPAAQRGFLLITAVVLIVVASLLLTAMVYFSATGSQSAASHLESKQALFVAESGIERALYGFSKEGAACTALAYTASIGVGSFSTTGTLYAPAATTLSAAISATDAIIPVASVAGYAPHGRLTIGAESINYTGSSATSCGAFSAPCLTGATRGAGGSTAAAHALGAAVSQNQCLIHSAGTVGNANRTVERAVSATAGSTGAMMVYAKLNGDGNVYYRRWNGTAWGAESTTGIAVPANIQFFVLRFARTRNEAILGIQSSTGDIRVQMWNGSTWTAPTGMPTPLANVTGTWDQQRGFDIRYETASDEAIIVYNTNTANQVSYRTWNGATWSGAATTTMSTVGIPAWIEMAQNPSSTSNDIVLLVLGSNGGNPRIYGKRWNGAAWAQLEAGAPTIWDVTVAPSTYKAMDVAYEQQTGRAMFIWGDDVSDSIRYRVWNGATLSVGATIPGLTAMANVASWIRLIPDPFSDQLMFGVMDAGRDLNTALWSGLGWSVHARHDNSTEAGNDRNFDIIFETHSSNPSVAWLVWGGRVGGTRWTYRKRWDGGWSAAAAMSDRSALVQLAAHPTTGAVFAALYQDQGSGPDDIKEQHLTGGGAVWSAEATIWGGQTVNNPVLERVYVAPENFGALTLYDWIEMFP
jgi:hypothetical protein